MRKCRYDLLKKHSGDLLYKAPPPKPKKKERERERVVIGQYRSHGRYHSCGAIPYIIIIIIIVKEKGTIH